jgi:predicted 2-oxoglutarate/Fe(II)-dependent dioxygenase YbiX/peroxiredoxin
MAKASFPPLPPYPLTGDPAPVFHQRSPTTENFTFDTVAGRLIVLCFFGSGASDPARAALASVLERRDLFDDERASFFGVTTDPEDETTGRIRNVIPGYRFFWDFDRKITALYKVDAPTWVVIDPTMRIVARIPFAADGSDRAKLIALIENAPRPGQVGQMQIQAPILVIPNVFEPALCAHLINLYESHGGVESGFMREVGGRTVGINDRTHKSRKDHIIEDKPLIAELQSRFIRRVVPEIAKAHMFHITRMERYIVSCYAAEDGGHFRAHRDNTTSGTAHRRFAVSVNLNDDFDGGEVSFPEYGPRSFKAPPGGAVVFSCALLHAVSQVTRGRRYAFLPFLYDDAAARIRDANRHKIDSPQAGPAS